MSNKWRVAWLVLVGAGAALAQDVPLEGRVNINLGKDSPVALAGMSTGDSHSSSRGAALVLDLHMSLTLRNTGTGRIHGVALRVVSQEVTVGGKGSVSIPSLNIGPGESFPVRIDMQLMRPTQAAGGPLVDVNLDGVLFEDLSCYGPDRLNSCRTMTAWEMEAQRDRGALQTRPGAGGAAGAAAGDDREPGPPVGAAATGRARDARARRDFGRTGAGARRAVCVSPVSRFAHRAARRLGAGGRQRSARAAHRGAQPLGRERQVRRARLAGERPRRPAIPGGIAAGGRSQPVPAGRQDRAASSRIPPCASRAPGSR
jgi:hypothetical protein